MKSFTINESNIGYIKLYEDEVKGFEEYKSLPNVIINDNGDEIIFQTFSNATPTSSSSEAINESICDYVECFLESIGEDENCSPDEVEKILEENECFVPDAYYLSGKINGLLFAFDRIFDSDKLCDVVTEEEQKNLILIANKVMDFTQC